MLSDHEREALRELERQFTTEQEPARPMTAHRVSRRHPGPAGAFLIMTMALLAMIMLMAGSLTGVLMFGSAAWLIWWSWLPSEDGPQQPP